MTENDIKAAFEAWNDLASRKGLPVAKSLNAQRKRQIRRRLDEGGGLAGWRDALTAVERSRFCLGERGGGWRADLDFVFGLRIGEALYGNLAFDLSRFGERAADLLQRGKVTARCIFAVVAPFLDRTAGQARGGKR